MRFRDDRREAPASDVIDGLRDLGFSTYCRGLSRVPYDRRSLIVRGAGDAALADTAVIRRRFPTSRFPLEQKLLGENEDLFRQTKSAVSAASLESLELYSGQCSPENADEEPVVPIS